MQNALHGAALDFRLRFFEPFLSPLAIAVSTFLI
jgi:hypothetical protein